MKLNQIILEGTVVAKTEKGFMLQSEELLIEVACSFKAVEPSQNVRIVGKLIKAGLIFAEYLELSKKESHARGNCSQKETLRGMSP